MVLATCCVQYDLLFFPPSAGFKLSPEQKEEGNLRAFSVCLGIFLEENGESLQGLCRRILARSLHSLMWCKGLVLVVCSGGSFAF